MYGPFDKQLELRNITDGAETATASETGIAFDARMAGDFKAIVDVSALDVASGNETYVVAIETDSVAGFSDSPVEVGRVTITGKGVYEVGLSGEQITKLDPNAAAIRAKATLAGTTPSLTYGAYLAPVV